MALVFPLAERAARLQALGYSELSGSHGSVPEGVSRQTLAALARGETHYTDRPGILPLRVRVSEVLSEQFGLTLREADTVITCGVTEARFVAVQELLAPDEALFDASGEQRLTGALVIRGATLADEISKAQAVYLTSAMPEEVQRGLLEHLPEDAYVIYEVVSNAGTFHPAQLATCAARTVTLGDLGTEEGLLSWRVGFLVAPHPSAAGLRDFKQALTICTTNLSQWAALALLEGA